MRFAVGLTTELNRTAKPPRGLVPSLGSAAGALLWAIVFSGVAAAQAVPPDVVERIRSSIEARYPDNYSMQKILIEDQFESHRFLQTYRPSDIPTDVFRRIKASIESRYPDNYSMQKTLIENQVESYRFLQAYQPPGVPRDVFERIEAPIMSRYPDNYSMQKTLIEDRVESYRSLHQ